MSVAALVILVPMLGRPHRVDPLLDSIEEATPAARVLFLTTPCDTAVTDAIDRRGAERLEVAYRSRGDYARKINAGHQRTTEPLLFLAACDLHFHRGWFEACLQVMSAGVGVVGTNDLTNRRTMSGAHSTHSLVARWYADLGLIDGTPGVLHEGYPHEFVDDELVGTAKHRGAWAHAVDAHVEHLHPMGGKAPMDDLYAAQRDRMARGRREFARRRRLWK